MQTTADSTVKGRKWISAVICLVLGLTTFWLYRPVGTHEFINLDDPNYVTTNPHVRNGVTSQAVWWAFTHSHSSNWHPVTWMSHMLDCQFFRLNPGRHHLVNVAFHVANTLLLFMLLRKLTGARWRSAFVAAVFALHPLHIESVAWVAERKDVLSTMFGLLTLWAYAHYVEQSKVQSPRSRVFYGLALVLFALGLMSKPMLVTWPFLMLLLDFWPLQRVSGFRFQVSGLRSQVSSSGQQPSTLDFRLSTVLRLVREKLPFFLLSVGACVVTLWAQTKAIAPIERFPFDYRMMNSLTAYVRYLAKTVWPDNLAIFYPFPPEPPFEYAVFCALVLAIISVTAVVMARRRPYLPVGWFWYIGTLVPVIGILQVGGQSIADRYMYIPMIGLLIVLAWGAAEVAARWRPGALCFGLAAVAALVACALQTASQLRYWRNTDTLFKHACDVTGGSSMAWNVLGLSHAEAGDYEQAVEYFTKAIAVSPQSAGTYFGMAVSLEALGREEEALANFQTALNLDPASISARNGFAVSLTKRGKPDEAEAELRKLLELQPDCAEARLNLALALQRQGKMDDAIQECKNVMQLDPISEKPHGLLASTLILAGRIDEAIAEYREAVRLNPQSVDARTGLGLALAEKQDFSQAQAEFLSVLKIKPGDSKALDGFGYVLALQGKCDEARVKFIEAAKLDPKFALVHVHLAICLTAGGDTKGAIAEYREALKLDDHLPVALNNLAWILASHPDSKVRDGKEAVALAERACRLTNNGQPFLLGTLAAAYAEAGRFSDAIAQAEKARDSARQKGMKFVAEKNEQLLKLYRAGQPYHEPAPDRLKKVH